jgi:hypothetical protein
MSENEDPVSRALGVARGVLAPPVMLSSCPIRHDAADDHGIGWENSFENLAAGLRS